MHHHVLAIFATLALSFTAHAQITYLPGTGCSGSPQTPIIGTAQIGTNLTILSDRFPCNTPQTTAYILLGLQCNQLPPINISCRTNPCVLLIPDIVLTRPISNTLTIAIPNDRTLVGFEFCAQGGCLTTFAGRNCLFSLNQIGRIKLTQ